jgi:tetratricopeptide (TPR) repeat protein
VSARAFVISLALVLGAPASHGAQDSAQPRASFERAAQAYRAGDLEGARQLWIALLEEPADAGGVERSAVLYDLGNVAYRQGRPLEAAGWYTACLRLDPRHADARANLELARAQAGLEPAERGDLLGTLRLLLASLTLRESEWLVLALCGLLALGLGFEALRGGALARRLSLAAALFVALALVPWIYNLREARRAPLFVVAKDGADLSSEPNRDAARIGRLAPAAMPERIDALPGWVRVRAGDGTTGWVEESAVLPLATGREG